MIPHICHILSLNTGTNTSGHKFSDVYLWEYHIQSNLFSCN